MEQRGGQVQKPASGDRPRLLISMVLVAALSISALTSFALIYEEPSDAWVDDAGPNLEFNTYDDDDDNYVLKFRLKPGAETSTMYDYDGPGKIISNPEIVDILILPEGLLNIGDYALTGLINLQKIKIMDRNGNLVGDGMPSTVTTIGSHAFEGSTKLCNLKLPASITAIKSYAFKDCSNIKINIEQCTGLTTIGEGAFEGCNFKDSGLTLEIPDSVTEIGAKAYKDCGDIETLTIGSGVETIGANAFKDCGDIETLTIGSNIETIGDGAFEGCTKIGGSLPIPDSVKTIGANAFKGCSKINALTIGSNVETIGDGAFEGCTKIDGNLSIPDSVTEIGANAFKGCDKIDALTIGSNVETIGDGAFEGCASIIGPDDNNLVIPSSVSSIGARAFYGCTNIGLFDIDGGDTSLTIGESAFEGCTKLKGEVFASFPNGIVSFPERLTAIGASAFKGCIGIYDINLGGVDGNTRTVGANAFEGCTHLQGTLIISKCISEIGASAFKGCTGITEIIINDDSTIPLTIGESAFEGCTGVGTGVEPGAVKTLTVTNKVSFIGKAAFKGCTGITGIIFSDNSPRPLIIDESAFQGCTGVTGTLTITGNLKEIRKNAFKGCTGVTGAVIDSKVGPLDLGPDVFTGCTFTSLEIKGNVNSIGKEAFRSFTSLTALTLGEGIIIIGESAFEGCTGITDTLSIPSSVTSIGGYAFRDCSNINTLNFVTPDVEGRTISIGTEAFCNTGINAVTFDEKRTYEIGNNAFAGLSFTGDLVLPKRIANIGEGAFKECTVTGELTIMPDGHLDISTSAFERCNNFTALKLNSNIVLIGERAFAECNSEVQLSLPDGLVTIGNYAFSESKFNDALTIPDTTVTIGNNAFYNCTGLASVTFGSSLQSIGNHAFDGCTGLTGPLTIPDATVTIGNHAFDGCTGLASVTFGSSLQSIGDYAFYNCVGAKGSLNIPDTVSDVGRYAFFNCSGFDGSLHISESMTVIRPYTFCGCSGLTGFPELPDMLIRVEGYAFHGCSGLNGSLILPIFMEYIGPYAFADCGFTGLVIPSSISNISGSAFYETDKLTEIIVGPGCTGVNANAFTPYEFYEEDGTTVIEYFTTGFAGYTFTKVPDTSAPVHMIRGNHVESKSVTYDVSGGSEPAPTQNNVEIGGLFIVKPYSGTNGIYVFDGWYDGHVTYQPGSLYEMGESDVVLQAIWVGIHKAIYNLDGGTGDVPAVMDVREGHAFELPVCTATKAGCEFGGWYYKGKVHEPGATMRMGSTDMEIVAVWREFHEVTYDIDGGSEPAPSGTSLLEGEAFVLEPYDGTKDGFELDGWVYKGRVYTAGESMTMGKNDIIILAHWVDLHHVTYDPNGGIGEAPVQPDVTEGTGFVLPDSTFTREGYHFIGWTYEGQVYRPGDSLTMGIRDMTIDATWKLGNPAHHVTYDLNGGSGDAPIQGDVEEGSVFVVKPYEGSRESMEFKGWSCNGELYQEGSVVTMGDKDMVLTAVWAEASGGGIDAAYVAGIVIAAIAVVAVSCVAIRRWYL